MDLHAGLKLSSQYSSQWAIPRLDSKTGFHNKAGLGNQPYWLQVDMPGTENFEVTEMSLKRRADGCCGTEKRTIDAVSF